jgi:hypothetical protein
LRIAPLREFSYGFSGIYYLLRHKGAKDIKEFCIFGKEQYEKLTVGAFMKGLICKLIIPWSDFNKTKTFSKFSYFKAVLDESKGTYSVKKIRGIGDWDDYLLLKDK